MSYIAAFLVISPWLIGGLLWNEFVPTKSTRSTHLIFSLGAGGMAGLVTLGFLITFFSGRVFTTTGIVILASISLTLVALTLRNVRRRNNINSGPSTSASKLSVMHFLLCLLIILLFLHLMANSALIPVAGWDALSHWAPDAITHIDKEFAAVSTVALDTRHYQLTSALFSWPVWVRTHLGVSSAGVNIWLLFQTSITLISFGTAVIFTGSRTIALFAAYLSLSTPLQENHVLVSGYSELLVSALLVSSVSLAMQAVRSQQPLALLGSLIFCWPIVFTRNTGLVYAVLPLIAIVMTTIGGKLGGSRPATKLASLFFLASALGTIFISGGQAFEFLERELNAYFFGANRANLSHTTWHDVLTVELHSKIIKASFSTGLLLIPIALAACALAKQPQRVIAAAVIPMMTSILGLTVLSISLFTDYGLQYALPTADTGHSRFAVPLFSLVPLIFTGAAISLGLAPPERSVGDKSADP